MPQAPDFRDANSPDLGSGWVDAHCHLADPRLDEGRERLLAETRAAGVSGYIQAGVDPADWQRQLELQKYIPGLIPVFGLHPYAVHAAYMSGKPGDAEQALDQLARMIHHCPLLGETGIDLRPAYRESEGFQIEMFETQVTLAEMAKKPVLLHLVRAFAPAERLLNVRGAPKYGGFVHAFAGSLKEAQVYSAHGLMMSIGSAILHPKSEKLRQAVKNLGIEHFLIESDAPDQAAFDAPEGVLNSPLVILRVAAEIGRLKGMTGDEVLATSKANLERLFRRPLS